MNPVYISRTLRLLAVLGLVACAFIAFYYISAVAYPFLIAFFIAFLINPLVNYLEVKIRMPRSLAVFITIVGIFALFAGLVTLLVAEIISGTTYLADVLPQHLNTLIKFSEDFFVAQLIPFYNKITGMFKELDPGQQQTIVENIQNIGKRFGTTVGSFLQGFFGNIPTILSWFPNAATVLVFSLLATFFISKDWYRLTTMASRLMPMKARASGRTVFADLKKALFGFVKAQLTLISITSVIILIGLLVLRVEYAITIALVAGIVDIIPYLGTGAVFVPWILYEAVAGDMGLSIGLGIVYIIVLVQRQIMEPKILSSSIGLDPLATLISLFTGFKLLGFIGLIAGPVVLVIFNTLKRAKVFEDIWSFIKGKEM